VPLPKLSRSPKSPKPKCASEHPLETGAAQHRSRERFQELAKSPSLALQLPFLQISESMGNHDSKIVDAASVD
jgi:hypothetical protein